MEAHWKHLAYGDRVAERLGMDACLHSELILQVHQACVLSWSEKRGTFKAYFASCLKRELMRSRRIHARAQANPARKELETDLRSTMLRIAFEHSPLESLIKREGSPDIDVAGIARRVLSVDELEAVREHYELGKTLWLMGALRGIGAPAMCLRMKKILGKLRDEIRQVP